jgi:hypothetical protein
MPLLVTHLALVPLWPPHSRCPAHRAHHPDRPTAVRPRRASRPDCLTVGPATSLAQCSTARRIGLGSPSCSSRCLGSPSCLTATFSYSPCRGAPISTAIDSHCRRPPLPWSPLPSATTASTGLHYHRCGEPPSPRVTPESFSQVFHLGDDLNLIPTIYITGTYIVGQTQMSWWKCGCSFLLISNFAMVWLMEMWLFILVDMQLCNGVIHGFSWYNIRHISQFCLLCFAACKIDFESKVRKIVGFSYVIVWWLY